MTTNPEAWEHLKRYGYAPGRYMNKCGCCGHVVMNVDKRAITCRACAEALHDKAINVALAKSIGWLEKDICTRSFDGTVWVIQESSVGGSISRPFDYRDPQVIWPIAKRYECFPRLAPNGVWGALMPKYAETARTPELAVALAVIGGAA